MKIERGLENRDEKMAKLSATKLNVCLVKTKHFLKTLDIAIQCRQLKSEKKVSFLVEMSICFT